MCGTEMEIRMKSADVERAYNRKKVTGEEAIRHIQSGQRVFISHCSAEPRYMVKLLAEHKEQYENVEIVQLLPLGEMPLAEKGMEKHFRYNSIFVGNATRNPVAEGRADYTPCFFYQVPELFRTTLPLDTAVIQVSKPDEHGYCSFGVSIDCIKAAAENARVVIAQVNENMPRTLGDSFIHINAIDYIVEQSEPIMEIPTPVIGEAEKEIGRLCASLIQDGDTIQIGIGSISDAVLLSLKGKKRLGIHSEMLSDEIVDLIESGVITNSEKEINRGLTVVSFVLGSRKLYDYVNNNPSIKMHQISYVNNPAVIMQHKNMVAINFCVEIDLMGQVASETVGTKQISAVGGQVDFVRGASLSQNGRSIIAMTSTAKNGTISKIVPFLQEGTPVTTSRNDVDYVVTEYGIAKLKGHTLAERARALIAIAHPRFRRALTEEWNKRFRIVG